jgi:hypothetical protein
MKRERRRRLQPDPREPCTAPLAAEPALDGAHGRGLALDDGQHPRVQLAAMTAGQAMRGDGLPAGDHLGGSQPTFFRGSFRVTVPSRRGPGSSRRSSSPPIGRSGSPAMPTTS